MPPTTGIIDNFNRANETPLASPWVTMFTGETPLNLASNVAQATNNNEQIGVHTTTSLPMDQEVYVTVAATTSSRFIFLEARVTSQNTASVQGYQAYVDTATNGWVLQKVISGSGTGIGSGTKAVAAGDKMWLKCTGSSIVATHIASGGAETAVISVTDTAVTGGGYIGIGLIGAGTSLTLDDFGGGSTKPAPQPNISQAAVRRAAFV